MDRFGVGVGRGASRGVAVVLLALALAGPARAQPAPPAGTLTLSGAIARALAQFPSVGASRAARDEAGAQVGEAQAGWLPTLALSGSATRYQKPMIYSPIHTFDLTEIPPFSHTLFEGALSLSYLLVDGGGRVARVRQARERAAAAEASLSAAEQSLVERVVGAYTDVLGRRQILDAHDHRLEALSSELGRVQQLLSVGRAAQIEVLRVEAAIASARAERVRLAVSLDAAERDLARLIGADPEEARSDRLASVALADTSLVSRGPLVEQAQRSSPSLEQSRRLTLASTRGLDLARSARWPELHLTGAYLDFADQEGNHEEEWNAALELSVPIFTGGSLSKGIERAAAASRGAGEQLRLAQVQLEQDVDRALSAVAEAHARVESLTRAVASYEEVARIEKLSLDAGSGTQTDYLDAQASLLASRASLVEARFEEITARVGLARISGTLDTAWLDRALAGAQ